MSVRELESGVSKHVMKAGGRAGWLTAATVLHGTVKEGWFEEACNQKQHHHPACYLIPEVPSTPIRAGRAAHERDKRAVPGGCGQGQVGGRLMPMLKQPEPERIRATECAR